MIYCDEKLHQEQSIVQSILSLKKNKKKWAVLVGPEGGFSDYEKEMIENTENVLSVSLGNRPLRSDTAITVALFCVKELVEDK